MSAAERLSMRIFLDTGPVIEFTCTEFTTTTSRATGQLTGYQVEGAYGSVPKWVAIDRIVAITREVSA